MAEQPFLGKMSRMQNEALAEIALSKEDDGFDPEAISAAKQEISRREIDPAELSRVELQAETANDLQRNRDQIPLPTNRWIAIAVLSPFSVFLASVFVYLNYGSRGYGRKATDSLKATLIGIAFYALISVVLSLLM